MEDLKKQTALRLAQEQQQKQTSYSCESQVVPPLSDQRVAGLGPFVQPQVAPFFNHAVPKAYPYQFEGNASPHGGQPNQPYHQQNLPCKPRIFNDNYSVSGQVGLPVEQMEIRQLSPENVQLAIAPRQDVDLLPIFRSSSSESPWSQVGMQKEHLQRKQKLPHGLTVSELKEMTKARLQAEAAEKAINDRHRDYSFDSHRMSPLDFDSVPETRERAPSRDSYQSNDIMHGGPGSTSSIPSLVQVNQQPRDVSGRQPQLSPLPAAFNNSGSSSAFHQRTDAWESISVASHNSAALSENYGSESVYSSSGVGSVNVQLSESDTFQNPGLLLAGQHQGIGREELSYHSSTHASPNNGNLYYFDAAIGGTRRRAMTSSPRPISIHEDHPIVYGDELRMPSFASPARNALQSRPSGNYSPVRGYGTDECMSLHPGLAPLGGTDLNRPRTFSATALPLRSPDAFEFNRIRANTFSGFSSIPPIEVQLKDKLTDVITESFLRVSHTEFEGSATQNSSFRHGVAAPPGFFPSDVSSNSLNQTPSFSTLGSWGDVQGPRSSLFEADLDNLTETMGSILKLSGLNSDGLEPEGSNNSQFIGFR